MEAGEERSDERAWILSDNISGTSDSEELLVLSAISYVIFLEVYGWIAAICFAHFLLLSLLARYFHLLSSFIRW